MLKLRGFHARLFVLRRHCAAADEQSAYQQAPPAGGVEQFPQPHNYIVRGVGWRIKIGTCSSKPASNVGKIEAKWFLLLGVDR